MGRNRLLQGLLILAALAAFCTTAFAGDTVVLSGSSSNTTTGTTAQYHIVGEGNVTWTTTEHFSVVPTAGHFEDLFVEMSTVGATESKTITLRKGTSSLSDTALTTTIANGTANNDTSNTVTAAAGDRVSISVVGNAASQSEQYRMGMIFVSDTPGETVIFGGAVDLTATTGTEFFAPQGGGTQGTWNATEDNVVLEIPSDGTLTAMCAGLSAPLGSGDTATLTLRSNNADTALTLTFTGAAQQDACISGQNVAVGAGADFVAMEWTVTGGTPDAVKVGWGLVFVPDTPGESIQMGINTADPSTSVANYMVGVGQVTFSSTSANRLSIMPRAGIVLKNLYLYQTTAPGSGKSYAYDLRLEAADTAVDCPVSDLGITCTSGADTATVASAGDSFNIGVTPSGTPSATGLTDYSFVTYIEETIAATNNKDSFFAFF